MTSVPRFLTMILLCVTLFCCQDQGSEIAKTFVVSTDQQFFALVARERLAAPYALFPRADSVTSGTLIGSTAHQPVVRVSMNPAALGALNNGTLPAGMSFPDGAVILKEIRINGQASLYAVVYKERNNPLAGGGWLWAEFNLDGTAAVSIQSRGSGCVTCHSGQQGSMHDHIRTFERQLP
jgi:hypothetical protein